MQRRFSSVLLLIVFAGATYLSSAQDQKPTHDWKPVENALGRSGQPQPGDVFKFSMPRKDLHVTVAGVAVKPALALGSWVAFKDMDGQAVAMGDLVLTESEVEPVMSKLEGGGVEITALHNHLLGETPRVMYMHIHAHGDAVKIADTLKAALALTKTPASGLAAPASQPAKIDFDQSQIEQALGRKGNVNGGVLQFSFPRAEKITDSGIDVPPSMGVATGINFQPTGSGRAAITGDFVLIASEVNPVIAALRNAGIEVTALHSHMLTEEPRLFFMHFWGDDDAVKLARGLRTALDKVNTAK